VLNAIKDLDVRIEQLIDSESFGMILAEEWSTENQQKFSLAVNDYFPPRLHGSAFLQGMELYVKNVEQCYAYGSSSPKIDTFFDSKYYEFAMISPAKTNWISYNDEENHLEIVRLVYDRQTYETLAFLVIQLSSGFILKEFYAYDRVEIENIVIANESGSIFSSQDPKLLGNTLDSELISQMDGRTGIIRQGNKLKIYSRFLNFNTYFPYEDWYTIIELDRQTILKDFYAVLQQISIFLLFIIVIEIIITTIYSKQMINPVKKLVSAMEHAHQNQYKNSFTAHTVIYEMKVLEKGFNEMVEKLNYLIIEVYENNLIHRELQLKVLRSQINPHFLFNTLQLISGKAHDCGADAVTEMLHSLSCMLDTDLYDVNENSYTICDEIAYIQHYAKIIRYKYAEKIQIEFDIPEALLKCQIPKLIFQPFIENAVVHGLAPKQDQGIVSITIRQAEHGLEIKIKDNGIGMRSTVLERLRGVSDTEISIADRNSHHIALKNIENRLRILYGEEYGFDIQSQISWGTEITMRLPYVVN
jgi:sensor histidine kinase YesM